MIRLVARLFISHRCTDTSAAVRLAADLTARGHVVRLDDSDLEVGDSILAWMNSSLGDAEFVILCLSGSGVDTPWVSREWYSALARQLNGEGVQLLPVKLTGGALPPLLADIKYADATLDWAAAVDALDSAVRRRTENRPSQS